MTHLHRDDHSSYMTHDEEKLNSTPIFKGLELTEKGESS